MPEPTTQFRAALHGYNREDVVDYIDRMTKEHDDTVQRLQKANAKLRDELAEANEALAAAKENTESEKALSDAQTLIADLRSLNEEQEDRIQGLEEELAQARAEREAETVPMTMDQEEALERLQKDNERLQTELSEVKEALAAAKENPEAEKALADAWVQYAELRNRNQELENQNHGLEEELNRVRGTIEAETASMTQANEEAVDRLQSVEAELREELTAAKEANAALQDELAAANESYGLLQQEFAAANAALAAAEANTARENSEAENALSDAQTRIEALCGRNGELESRIQSLEEELAQTRDELENRPIPPVAEAVPVPAEPGRNYEELELAAYRRAEMTERLARERAEGVYRQVQSVFGDANGKLDERRAELEQISQALASNVNEMLAALTNLNSTYRQTEASFFEIGAKDRQLLEENN